MDDRATSAPDRAPAPGPPIVGRGALLARLTELAGRAHQGAGRAVCLVGPPGIGKSAISKAVAGSIEPATVLTGRCVPPPARPLRPLSEFVVAAIAAGATLDVVDDTVFGAGVRLLLGDRTGDPPDQPAPLLGEGLRLIASPLAGVVVWRVEDLHWADDESLEVLDDLVSGIGRTPGLMLLTSRRHASEAADRMIDEWVRRDVADVVAVPPLPPHEVANLVQTEVGDAISAERVERIVAASDGNPLLAVAFARDARDLGPGRHPARLPPPESYRVAVERRLHGLSDPVRSHVGLAAIIGRSIDVDVLSKCGIDRASAVAAAASAMRAQLADRRGPDEPVRFTHDLTRDAIVDSLDAVERRRLAARALDTMLDHDLDDDALHASAQLAQASGDDLRAAELLIRAARNALAMGAPTTALARLDSASALGDAIYVHRPALGQLRLEALALAGRAVDALALGATLLNDRAFHDDPERHSRLVLALARAAGNLGDWSAAAAQLDEAFAADLDDDTAPAEVQSYRSLVAIELGDVDRAAKLATRMLERGGAAPAARCEAHEVLGRVARERSYADAADEFRSAVAAATEAGLGLWRARALLELGLCDATMYGSPDTFEEASRSARRIGAVGLSAMCDYNLANLLGLTVRPHDALSVAQRGVASAQQIEVPILEALCWTVAGQAHAELNQLGEARRAADRARAVAPDEPEVEAMALGMCQAFGLALRGELDESAQLYAESLGILRALPVVTATAPWYFGPVVLAAALHPSLDAVRAQMREPSFQAVPSIQLVSNLTDAIAAGHQGDHADVAVHLEALRECRRRHPWFASTGEAMSALLEGVAGVAALRDGWGDPVGTLTQSRAALERAGVDHTARWFGSVLRDAGMAPRRGGRVHDAVPASLTEFGVTAREYEVLQLLADRRTNREIATELVVAPSTVKTHVERLLAKTGRRNRIELGELATTLTDPA
ncbi:MAG: AAA family ATPase [Ilumatobacteraceae bacterium]|nr:AAA family ATPase [Ilumatobacteraceae bacterium]